MRFLVFMLVMLVTLVTTAILAGAALAGPGNGIRPEMTMTAKGRPDYTVAGAGNGIRPF